MAEKQTVRFGDICREVKLTTKDPLAEGYDKYIGLEHLDSGSLKIKHWGSIAEDNPSFTRVFKKGHILFGKRRSYLKKAAIAEFDGICSGDIIVMEPKGNLMLPELLPFIVQSERFWDWAIKTSSGSLSPRTKFDKLATFHMKLLSQDKQMKILCLCTKLRQTINFIDELTENYLQLRKIIFDDFFIRCKKEKNEVFGADIFTIVGGHAPSKLVFNAYGKCAYFKVDDFNKNEDCRDLIISSENYNESDQNLSIKNIEVGDIVFPKRGAAIFKNRVGLAGKKGTIDSNLMGLKCSKVESEYIRIYLEWFGLFNISDNSGIPQINNKHINPLRIPTYSIAERNKVIALDNQFSKLEKQLKSKTKKLYSVLSAIANQFSLG